MSLTVEKCLQAWTNSLKQMNSKADIVFFGDSLTYYGDFSSVYPDKVVCNLGLRGDTIQGMIGRIEQVRVLAPKKVFLMAGINDVSCCSYSGFSQLYEKLIISLLSIISDCELFIQGLLPVNDVDYSISCNNNQITSCNAIISHIADRMNLKFLDLFSPYAINGILPKTITKDGLHLNLEAYDKWYNLVKAY